MKKYLPIIALATIAFVSCNKEEIAPAQESQTEQPGTHIVSLNAVGPDITKTSYADEKTFSWDANDEISVLFHKDEDHKFFTLKTTTGGTEATFTGEVTDGYEIGASATEGGAKYALFPAGAHTWNYTDDRPIFNIPSVTDFTAPGAHISANLPMYAIGDESNNFAFKHNACAYKFTFTDLDASKVRLTVTHNTTHQLSGNFPLNSAYKWYAQYASLGSANQSVSYIKNVSSKTASFYFVIGKDSESSFQPTITLYDETTGYILYRATAKSAWGGVVKLAPDEGRMVILPSISAPGSGLPFISKFGINWSDPAVASASGDGACRTIKAKDNSGYLYLFLDLK